MPYDSQGVFTRVMNWQEDAANAVPIVASRHDDEDDNFAQGFNDCFCRDGRATAQGNFKMGGYKMTGLGNGTTNNDAINYGQLSATQTTLQGNIDAIETLIKSKIYGVGSIYAETTNTNPNTTLGFGTWELITSSVVIPSGKISVFGNGKTLGFTNGTNTGGLYGQGNIPNGVVMSTGGYNKDVGTAVSGSNITSGLYFGVVTSGESGIEVDMASATSVTIYIWKRTA